VAHLSHLRLEIAALGTTITELSRVVTFLGGLEPRPCRRILQDWELVSAMPSRRGIPGGGLTLAFVQMTIVVSVTWIGRWLLATAVGPAWFTRCVRAIP
jgi:hypothetical protein